MKLNIIACDDNQEYNKLEGKEVGTNGRTDNTPCAGSRYSCN